MRKIVSFMHVSLDGFVTGPQGEMDWIHVDDDLFDYAGQRTREADMALYGRNTYQLMESYWPTAASQPNATKHDIEHSAWYSQVAKVVISKTMQGQQLKNTTIISDDLPAQIQSLKQQPGNEIIMFGSPGLSHSLVQHHLIDEWWLFINPILVGRGIPMFKDVTEITRLQLVKNVGFKSGVVCLHYQLKTKS